MNSAEQHYEQLLARVYAWSVASAGDPTERAERWLREHGLLDAERYLDLGAGFGAHVLPLLAAGKQVTAVDFNAELLAQLAAAASGAPRLSLARADLVDYLEASGESRWDVILCLGDTLTHLDSTDRVERLLASAVRHLKPEGRLAIGYRDSSEFQAEGLARFVPVASDHTRSMHCLLEPIDATYLRVTDIVTDVTAEGPRTRLSDYRKLRIACAALIGWAGHTGLQLLSQQVDRGMTSLVFRRLRAT